MRTAFVDTSYLLALMNSEDEYHGAAAAIARSYRGRLITTEYVLLEILDAMTAGPQRAMGSALVESLREDEDVDVIAASHELFEAGFELFQQRDDKQWGITDCISFVVMQQKGVSEAFTADHHFEQAGFRALLRQ